MRGYLNLLMLGYLPWVIVEQLMHYISLIPAVLISLAIIAPFAYKAAKQHDYIGLIVVLGFFAYCANLLFHIHVPAIYVKNILLVVGLAALLSVIIKKPFTITYAKQTVSPDKWDHPTFIKINRIISSVWTGIFLIEYALKLFDAPYCATIGILLVIGGFMFSSKFPDYYLKTVTHAKH